MAESTYKFLLVSFVLTFLLLGCVMEEKENPKVYDTNEYVFDLDKIIKRGKLVVLAENSSSSYFEYREKEMGFEYEILKEFTKELGIELEVKVIDNLDHVIDEVKNGDGDVIACNLTVTADRKKIINFSRPLMSIPQVLVQRNAKSDSLGTTLFVTDASQLAKKNVNVWKESSYYDRLKNLQEEIGDTIYIRKENGIIGTEELIEMVSEGMIDYTVVEQNVAQINARFFDNLDVSVPLSAKQKIAFGMRMSSPLLKARMDNWLDGFTKTPVYKYIYHKYFELGQMGYRDEDQTEVTSTKNYSKGKLEVYEQFFRDAGTKHNVDWRWLAALSFQESRLNPNAVSFGGAYSMMQFMPEIGPTYGVYHDSPPEVQINGGAKKISHDFKIWKKTIKDDLNCMKFTLASYNCGQGHVYDAQRLATKYGKDPKIWDNNVEDMILRLSKKEFYGDEAVRHGAMRGTITYKYVREIYARYLEYKVLYK